ncbi:hypothetical protein CK203_100936 [Vitis vinifera]|uniref:Uncharacterized protein n=1 Tax=Vitis vinifera TaxID=29760 RepID=A0A438CJI1_VITVI|nr:hypothetical protein CK203_100936 [Vitis vinifera]
MMAGDDEVESKHKNLEFEVLGLYYQDAVTVPAKVKNLSWAHPSSLGHLRQLESLDLSTNKLEREIPTQLASLKFPFSAEPLIQSIGGKNPNRMEIDWDYVAPEIGIRDRVRHRDLASSVLQEMEEMLLRAC